MADDERLINIESKLAHQEHTLAELGDVLGDQQARLMQLERLCESLVERMRALAENSADIATTDEKPPHY